MLTTLQTGGTEVLAPALNSLNEFFAQGVRVLLLGETKQRDYDSWRQCHICGLIVPIYEHKKESKLKDFVETSDNPFDSGHITGLGNKSNERKLTESQKEMKRLKEQIEKEKDIDIKQELKRGNTVTIIEDSFDY